MTTEDLLNKGYFPKELPPCFFTKLFGSKFSTIFHECETNLIPTRNAIINAVNSLPDLTDEEKTEERNKRKQLFNNSINFSDSVRYSIPKSGIARTNVKIPNPLHQGKLAKIISENYSHLSTLYNHSSFSTTKPETDTENGENHRSLKHESYKYFKESCILNSFKYAIELKTDISKFYPSIYTHSVPWVTFGGKSQYKRNYNLHKNDPNRNNDIYGDDIDKRLTWCQNQQTMGIPIGPDTSFIIAEVIACHIDKLLERSLKNKKIDFLGFRYYDDYALYFNNEVDAQIGLTQLKNILYEFELKINDKKTHIGKSQNELEKDWALAIKSFYFRPSCTEQKDDIWNFFSIAFKFAALYPNGSVLKLSLNKFNFVRIEKENWTFFESLIFRLGLTDTSALKKIAQILVSYKPLVSKKKLKNFCFEVINRHYKNKHDYELSWALWILKEFNIQPTKATFEKVFHSTCVCASLIALDLLNQNNRIQSIDLRSITSLITTENLNTKYWLLSYETIYKNWISSLSPSIITDHYYFNILKSNDVFFYDSNRKLEPLKTERSYYKLIERKITQLSNYIIKSRIDNNDIKSKVSEIAENLDITQLTQETNREEVQNKLSDSEAKIKILINKIELIKSELTQFERQKPYFVIGKRLEELGRLTSKELDLEHQQNKGLLYNPDYE